MHSLAKKQRFVLLCLRCQFSSYNFPLYTSSVVNDMQTTDGLHLAHRGIRIFHYFIFPMFHITRCPLSFGS